MCGRFVVMRQLEEIARLMDIRSIQIDGFEPSFNVAPTRLIPAAVDQEDERALVGFHWGFTPRWADSKTGGPRPINARSETVATSGMFRDAFRRRRCLIPADGFYEWQAGGQRKQPFYIHRADDDVMAFAGIWEHWQDPTGEIEAGLDSCAIITTGSNAYLRELHERMPVILEREDWDLWLDPEVDDADVLTGLLRPAEDRVLEFHPVNPDVGNVRNDRPDLVEPFEQQRLIE